MTLIHSPQKNLHSFEVSFRNLKSLPTIDEVDAALAKRSLAEYIRQAWEQVEPGRALIWNWHIELIAEHLEACSRQEIRKLLINIPPRFAKSLLVCVFWPTWLWLQNPSIRMMFASYSRDFSKRDSLRCRRIIESPWYQRRWGHLFSLSSDQNEKLRFDNDKTGFRMSTSVGGTATGEGGDIKVVDDPHKPDEVHSDTTRNRDLTWWKETWSSRVNDEKTCVNVVVMQRLDALDLSAHLIKEEGDWEHLCLPLEYEPKRFFFTSLYPKGYDPRKKAGELLFPERVGPEEKDNIKRRSGSYGYAGQYQQRPSPEEGGLFKRKWWRFWKPDGLGASGTFSRPEGCQHYPAKTLPKLERQIISLDAAFKGKITNDYVVFTVWGSHGADRYLLDMVRGHFTFTQTISAFRKIVETWPYAFAKIVEDTANGPAIIDALSGEIGGIIPIKPEGGKEARAFAVQPQVESGNVYLPDGKEFLGDFLEEFSVFPNGAHDDIVDSTTQALTYLSNSQDISRALALAKD